MKDKLKQYYLDKYEHDLRCDGGIITRIDEFTGDVSESECPYCLKMKKAKELKSNGKG